MVGGKQSWWRDRIRWRHRLALVGFLVIAGFFLITEHRAHLFGALPYVLLIVGCLLLIGLHRDRDKLGQFIQDAREDQKKRE